MIIGVSTCRPRYYSRMAPGQVRRTGQDVLEGKLDVAGIEGGRFYKGQVVLAWMGHPVSTVKARTHTHTPTHVFKRARSFP